jgi:hypothetical protein
MLKRRSAAGGRALSEGINGSHLPSLGERGLGGLIAIMGFRAACIAWVSQRSTAEQLEETQEGFESSTR